MKLLIKCARARGCTYKRTRACTRVRLRHTYVRAMSVHCTCMLACTGLCLIQVRSNWDGRSSRLHTRSEHGPCSGVSRTGLRGVSKNRKFQCAGEGAVLG